MMKNIKSVYFIKYIFSLLDEPPKIKISKYNKGLQKLLDLNLLDYRRLSGKYIIYEEDSRKFGKEYDCKYDDLLYEGEYLNGERNGKGKEYINFQNKIILEYEGKFLKGKKNGKGKEYYHYTNLKKFEGYYLNGKKWSGKGYDKTGKIIFEISKGNGMIKEYNNDDRLKYEGGYKNGERNGKGKEYNYDDLIFEGEFLNNKRWNGKGYDKKGKVIYKLTKGKGYVIEYYWFNNNKQFEGEYSNGQRNGKGKEYEHIYEKIEFEGEYKNGKRHGKGKEYFNSHDNQELEFEGEYKKGKRHGKGKEYEFGTLIFQGDYLYGFKYKGKSYAKKKLDFEGEYLNDKKWNGIGYNAAGKIIYKLINGFGTVKEYGLYGKLIYSGGYLDGKKHGEGIEFNSKGEVIYEGEYSNGKRNGKGILYADYNKIIYEGEFLNGIIWKGRQYYDGILSFEGEFLKGEKWNGIDYFCNEKSRIVNGKLILNN